MKSPKGKIWSWILFVVIMLAIFAGLLFLQNRYSQTNQQPNQPVNQNEEVSGKTFAQPEVADEEKEALDQKAFNDSILEGKDCSEIKFDQALRQQCEDTRAYQLAIDNNDQVQCERINDNNLRQSCLDQVYFALANLNANSRLCENINQNDLKTTCLDQVRFSLLTTIESESDCEVIQTEPLKQNCLNNFYLATSLDNLNEDGCLKINDASKSERCRQSVKQTSKVVELAIEEQKINTTLENKQIAECTTDECQDQKQYNLAFENKDLSYCNKIKDNTKKEDCLKTQSISINQSYLRQAISTQDASICNKILDSILQSLCLSQLQDS